MAFLKFPGRKFARYLTEYIVGPTVMFNNYDEIITDCFNEFAAPESEHNWSNRAALCARLSAQLEKTKPTVPKDFFDRIRPLLGSFVDAAMSERTNLAKNACSLLGSICKTVGSLINPHMDYLMPKLITICSSTKKISQQKADETIMTICQTAGFSPRLLHHICSSFTEKSKFVRKYAPIWLTTIIQTYQFVLDPEKDYRLIEQAIMTGLNDGEKDTRDATRATYWTYAKLEKTTANKIMEGLNPHAATALRTDSNNPNKPTGPAKPARPESALAQIRAAKTKQAQTQVSNKPQPQSQPPNMKQSKRNITPMSIQSDDMIFGSIERIDAPDGVLVPLPPSPKVFKDKHRDAMLLKDPPSSAALRSFMGQPARRPRVVATPMSTQNQTQTVARPTSKGETTSKKPTETTQRSAIEKKSSRQVPTIHEDSDARLQSSISSKSSLHMSHKSESFKTTTNTSTMTRPSSSSSEPAGNKSPKRHAVQHKSSESHSLRHQKSSSVSESPARFANLAEVLNPIPISETSIPAPASGAMSLRTKRVDGNPDTVITEPKQKVPYSTLASRLKTMSPPEGFIPDNVLQAMSPPHIIDGKENAEVQQTQKQVIPHDGDPIAKARRSLAAITEALRQGRLDALGYRKLKKLVRDHPRVLFTSSEQFNDFYTLLISSIASIEEYQGGRDGKAHQDLLKRGVDFTSTPVYNRTAIIETAIAVLEQYEQYEEPQPGMTFIALLYARGNHPGAYHVGSTMNFIEWARDRLLSNFLVQRHSNAVMENVFNALLKVEPIIQNNDPVLETPDFLMRPLTAKLRAERGLRARSDASFGPLSYQSEFGEEEPPKLPERLPGVMAFGVTIVTELIRHQRSMSWKLSETQEQRLAEFAKHLLRNYRKLIKREVMGFCATLFNIIPSEERFYSLFEDDSDRNLVTYCIGSSIGEEAMASTFASSF